MAIPNELMNALNILIDRDLNFKDIDDNAKEISKKYRANDNDGKRLVTKQNEAIAYALSRMPATYESVTNCIKNIFENNKFDIKTILDVGAGTGAATWAAYNFFEDKKFLCLERESEMINIGKKLMQDAPIKKYIEWKQFDIIENNIKGKFDLVIVSYMMNELPKDKIDIAIEKLWNATSKVLLVLEPGTPKGYSNIINIRELLLKSEANIIAPCTHHNKCLIQDNDWCQFTCRVQRSKIHKRLKDGTSPYEDEKFSYIAVSKSECIKAKNRILRHPIINKGFSEFKVCNADGIIKNVKLSKKDGILYKEAKKKSSGDSLDI